MQRQSAIQRWCNYVIEAGWLLALSLVPIYFNLLSSRHFEPDKATTLRAIVLVMASAWLIRALDGFGSRPATPEAPAPDDAVAANPFAGLWRRLREFPLALPALVYALVFLIATAFSVVRGISFWGSYQRGQGAYTNLSYIALFALMAATLRTRAQFDRLVTVLLFASLPVSGYGLIQHFQLDPLPWKGDVISRVASTMGNSIFVAAYLIMVLPFALYRLIANIAAVRNAPRDGGRSDAPWGFAYALLSFGTLALLLAVIKFGAVVRVPEPTFRYWWVFPGAIAICTAIWALVAHGLPNAERVPRAVFVTGALTLGFFIIFGLQFLLSQATGQQFDSRQVRGMDWGWWLLGGIVALGAFFALAYLLPRRAGPPSRALLAICAAGNAVVVAAALATIFFTQSRGPWLGGAVGVFVFFTLVLWMAARRARTQGSGLAGPLRAALVGWVVLALAVGGFLLAFNLSDAPMFAELRNVPYIGRMGRLLETDSGTGLVRRLIWFGDEHGGGAVGLITANPWRAVVGWGPESMFVAYNPFYPPALANIEARGASPDRSHQAILDELVTKGFLGLLSYLFLLISFVVLCWRLIRRSEAWHWQVFFIACLGAVAANFVEGLTGIPIVATLMMLWVVLGATVVGGHLAGAYSLDRPRDEPAPAPQPAPASAGKGRSQQRPRGAVARGAATARAGTGRRPQTTPAALGLYALLLVLTGGAVWWFNLNPVYADMRFQEAQAYSDNPQAGLREEVVGLDKYLDTIRRDPDEDFYYLNLGRTLMNTADLLRAQGAALGEPAPGAKVDDLLRLSSIDDVTQFITSKSPLALMSYAEAVLLRARDLNPRNKDHYANLARLNSYWYSWTNDPQRITQSADWYKQATEVAPNDVAIANERASAVALLGTYTEKQGDAAGGKALYAEAEQLLARSRLLDPRFNDTGGRLAEVYRLQGKLAEATPLYTATLAVNPHQFDANVEGIATSYQAQPELLKQIQQAYLAAAAARPTDASLQAIAGLMSVRAGDLEGAVKVYAAAVAAAPNRLDFVRNYTLVLSDTRRYPEALAQAQQGLNVAQQQGEQADQQELATFQFLVELLQQKAAGGQ